MLQVEVAAPRVKDVSLKAGKAARRQSQGVPTVVSYVYRGGHEGESIITWHRLTAAGETQAPVAPTNVHAIPLLHVG